jgi:hypothetical protein
MLGLKRCVLLVFFRLWVYSHGVQFHKAYDSLRTADLKNFYAIDATLVFANNEPIFGLQNIVKVSTSFGLHTEKVILISLVFR